MADDEDHGKYLTSEELLEKIYGYLKKGEVDSAVAHMKSLGDHNVVVNS